MQGKGWWRILRQPFLFAPGFRKFAMIRTTRQEVVKLLWMIQRTNTMNMY